MKNQLGIFLALLFIGVAGYSLATEYDATTNEAFVVLSDYDSDIVASDFDAVPFVCSCWFVLEETVEYLPFEQVLHVVYQDAPQPRSNSPPSG